LEKSKTNKAFFADLSVRIAAEAGTEKITAGLQGTASFDRHGGSPVTGCETAPKV